MNTSHILTAIILFGSLASQAAVLIDLDTTTPGIQTNITDATEGQVLQIGLVITGFTDINPCMNGIGGDISSRGSMTVTFGTDVLAGDIATFTNEGFSRSVITNFPVGPLNVTTGQPISTAGLAPLSGYTQNVGGAGLIDLGSNLNGDQELFSFIGTPGSAGSYATIFTTTITVTNVNGTTLELFPSGIFDNPATQTMGGEVALLPIFATSAPAFTQDGSLNLHTEGHDFQPCGPGPGALSGASITGVPEPSTAMLTGAFACVFLLKRRRS